MPVFYPQCWVAFRVYFDGLGGNDSREMIVPPIEPREASVGLNGYNLADTFEVSFFADHLPIAPELVRAMGVDVYLFQTPELVKDPRPYLVEKNRIITGIVDEFTADYTSDGRVIRASGRDYTGLLLDKKWTTAYTVPLGKDLRDTVQDLLDVFHSKITGGRGIKLRAVYGDAVKDLLGGPIVGGLQEGITTKKRVLKNYRPSTSKGRSKVQKKRYHVPTGRSWWDVIYELCLSYGLIAHLVGEEVVLHEPQSLTDESQGKALHYAYGHNLASLSISRKLSNHAAPQVVASYYDQAEKKFVEVRFPPDAPLKVSGGGGVTQNFRRVVPPAGIEDKETLRSYLSAAYHMYGRSEASIKFQTKALRGLQGKETGENDLLQLRPGHPIAIGWDSVGRTDIRERTPEERRTLLLGAGFSELVASVVAQNFDRLDSLRRHFYTKAATFHWGIGDGVSVDVEAINYVVQNRDEVRA